ncbi:sarcosine oxidase subunit gamma [Mesorhizobium sp. B283B1A]|uniref:sarcosine oxidase subunit gamma n=1 Tax=Mesorhizobium TaxID=68287 RepID=UPI001CD05CE1|nr:MULTISPECIES: sarcosine oxidase subunit gamma [Mesorhizobium]MCA0046973.1 sarcosine oxidase subunit gamma [Mesorhizobium sp. B283B1A]UQS66618.1 sarcosine oxidase subunit gamma [Mesorhizobium opportunistum]
MAKAAAKKVAPAASPSVERRSALAGRAISATGVKVEILPPAERISLRAPEASVAALSKALGVILPKKPKTSVSKAGRTVLWLGPDEWFVIDEAGNDPLAACATVAALHSAVGVSHRNIAIAVTGAAAAATINSGCPQDLSLDAFPVGAASRTILGKAEIVLLRTAADAFRVECWRSFSDYVFTFLSEGARDAAV